MNFETLILHGSFDEVRTGVIAAMLFPRSEHLCSGYQLRMRLASPHLEGKTLPLSFCSIQDILNLPSREELAAHAVSGVRRGTVAGDLLALIYAQWREEKPEPSLRSALSAYRKWSLGKTYGDRVAMNYSDSQLRGYWKDALPCAHLWAAHRINTSAGLPDPFSDTTLGPFLELAKELQEFGLSFIPKRTKPAKSVLNHLELFAIPKGVKASPPESIRLL